MLVLPQATNATPRAGVKAGEWASYDATLNFTGNATLVKNYANQYSAYANTSYVRLNITAVYGTNVSLAQSIHHNDGTVFSSVSTVNVSLSIDTNNPPIIIMQNYGPTLGTISSGSFFNVQRTINTLALNSASGNLSSALRYSWDNETGLLLSKTLSYNVQASDTDFGTFTFVFVVTGTSLWHYIPPKTPPSTTPPTAPFGLQFAELYVLAGIIGSVAIGAIAYAMKRSPKSKSRSRTGARDSRRDSRDLN